MKINLKRAIKSIKDDILFLQPLYEAIVNSFQANANQIEIKFVQDDDKNIIGYSVKDNGEGFTNKNLESFLTYWSDLKITIGGLGSGRVLCLKVFDNVFIKSQTKSMGDKIGQYVEIDFNRNFSKNEIKDLDPKPRDSDESWTINEYKNINQEYMNYLNRCDSKKGQEQKGNINRVYNLDIIKNKIFINLLPLFIRLRDEDISFEITIDDKMLFNKDIISQTFKSNGFKKDSFTIEKTIDDLDVKEVFNLTYQISHTEEGKKDTIEQFYGASDRKVTSFPADTSILSLPKGYSAIFCLSSPYFQDKINDSRAGFTIKADQNNPTFDSPIVFKEINDELRSILSEIVRKEFPELEKNFKAEKEKLNHEYPYLTEYINEYNQITMPVKNILEKSRQQFYKKREKTEEEIKKFVDSIKNEKFNKKKYDAIREKFTEVGKEQLASYMAYRQTIIDMLMNISEKSKKKKLAFDEGDIHDLFLERGKDSKTIDNRYANNVWIFDDKFMSYIYVASDKTIKSIAKDILKHDYIDEELKSYHKGKEPDLLMFFSEDEDNYRDVLLIEFKRLGLSIDKKIAAISQLRRYPVYIQKSLKGQNIRSIFTYTILDLDEETREALIAEDFDPYAFGDIHGDISSYYYYAKNSRAHINVLSFEQLICEADARNQVFLNILRNKIK